MKNDSNSDTKCFGGQDATLTQGTSRRTFVKSVGLVAAASAVGWPGIVSARSKTINVTCWGGAYEDAIRKAFAEPFELKTGIRVNLVNNADLARMKVQVQNKRVAWDVFDSIGPQIMAGSKQGLWEKIDTSIVDSSGLVEQTGEDNVGTYFYAGGIGFDPKRYPERKHPETFAEFWDVERFPGRRGLRSRINENLEMALLADGVLPGDLYPLDIERGFAALDRIKPHVRKWIQSTPQTVTLIASGDLDFTYTYLSRVLPAQRAGTSVAMSMKQTLNSLEYLAVPKHGRNTAAAMRYVNFCLQPENQAKFCELVEFSPNAQKAMSLVGDDARARMPDMKSANAILIDDVYWGEHFDNLQRRFTEWMLM